MDTREFIRKTKPGDWVEIEGKKYKIVQKVLWLMFVNNDQYFKYVLKDEQGNQDYRLAPDEEKDQYIFVKMMNNKLKPPFPKKVKIIGIDFKQTYGEWCRVSKIWGKKIYKIGDEEIWWDYEDGKGNYLSIGWNNKTGKREDLIGRWVRKVEEQNFSGRLKG